MKNSIINNFGNLMKILCQFLLTVLCIYLASIDVLASLDQYKTYIYIKAVASLVMLQLITLQTKATLVHLDLTSTMATVSHPLMHMYVCSYRQRIILGIAMYALQAVDSNCFTSTSSSRLC